MAERRYYKRKVELDEIKGNLSRLSVVNDVVLEILLKQETYQELYAAITRLDLRQKEVIYMIYVKEMPLKDVATALSVSPSYISRLHKKTLRQLQIYLNELN